MCFVWVSRMLIPVYSHLGSDPVDLGLCCRSESSSVTANLFTAKDAAYHVMLTVNQSVDDDSYLACRSYLMTYSRLTNVSPLAEGVPESLPTPECLMEVIMMY
ncbi:hypothetical protein RO3G_04431 [Rhizopus delemar RA 99-880]|uniref:Uncharacterized protein n=1 Tax=Rhizopus delemar (strain RA 99-880 / ATCC MYA-4621 / FGSC 9543 / NRRL 43880) TaxID=246409 RepID=I1BU46_RHIO9|nr:hypothetical protein RO3G_04431 [Rhizopus delemar RA 99-880]|eukprot:EIE79726.1 hypothetical protein RO3G_04431 [Rhizopus delemar RA 99-880]